MDTFVQPLDPCPWALFLFPFRFLILDFFCIYTIPLFSDVVQLIIYTHPSL